jgi:hypothetical protein
MLYSTIHVSSYVSCLSHLPNTPIIQLIRIRVITFFIFQYNHYILLHQSFYDNLQWTIYLREVIDIL